MDTLVAVTVIALERMSNIALASANNALTGFGKLSKGNHGYKSMLDASMIREDGVPQDIESLLSALSFEINRRVGEGTFN